MQFTSPILATASGKIAGLVASRNRSGQYFRGHVVPVNPNTSFQETMRTYFAQLAVAWIDELTDAQRDAWEAYAANVAMTGRLGQTMHITGQNHYIRSNAPRLQAALPRVDDGPETFTLGSFTEPTMQPYAAADTIQVGFTTTDDWVGEDDAALLCYFSRPKNPTTKFFKGPYRFADVVAGDSVTPPTSPATISSPFALAAGQRQFGRFAVSRADGRLTYDVRLTDIVDAET